MKLYLRLILSGALLIALAFIVAACSGGTQIAPSPAPQVTEAPVVATSVPTDSAGPILEIAGLSQSKSLTMEDLKALPAMEGYAGTKSSTGKITTPVKYKGVALKELAKLVDGMDTTTGFSVLAKDGYSITYSFDQIQNGTFVEYDPATGSELKNPVEVTIILAYEENGKPIDPNQDGPLRMAIVSADIKQVVDGHLAAKWINKIEVKSLSEEWNLHMLGAISKNTDRASVESCGAPQCHAATWTDDKAQEWVGVPLWLFVGSVDDEIAHEGPAFNDALADAGYNVDVIASDGYKVTFDAARVKRNNNIIVAYKVNDNQLPEEFFPLRLVGSDLTKKEMVGMIKEIKVGLEPIPATAEPAATASASSAAEGLLITGLMNQEMTYTEADLRGMHVLKVSVDTKNGKQDFEGISLNGLLDMEGVKDGATKLVATASDGYTSEVSLADVRNCSNCLIAFTDTPGSFTMVLPDQQMNTWVKNVVKLEVK